MFRHTEAQTGIMGKMILKGTSQMLILVLAMMMIAIQILSVFFGILASDDESLEAVRETLQESMEKTGLIETEESGTDDKNVSEAAESEDDAIAPTLKERIFSLIVEKPEIAGMFYFLIFLLNSAYILMDLFPLSGCVGISRKMILIHAALYLVCGIPFLISGYTMTAVFIMNILYTVILSYESVIRIREKRKAGRILLRSVLPIMAVVNLFLFPYYPFLVLGLIILRSLKQILTISFSQIRIDILKKIIRKTYAAEILTGMLLLIIAFSFLLIILDENFHNYGDALWFCFATVTTIGYGDVTSASILGRILSVILGVYGIIVVALITSIIVNFYNETKSDKGEAPAAREQDADCAGEVKDT